MFVHRFSSVLLFEGPQKINQAGKKVEIVYLLQCYWRKKDEGWMVLKKQFSWIDIFGVIWNHRHQPVLEFEELKESTEESKRF